MLGFIHGGKYDAPEVHEKTTANDIAAYFPGGSRERTLGNLLEVFLVVWLPDTSLGSAPVAVSVQHSSTKGQDAAWTANRILAFTKLWRGSTGAHIVTCAADGAMLCAQQLMRDTHRRVGSQVVWLSLSFFLSPLLLTLISTGGSLCVQS